MNVVNTTYEFMAFITAGSAWRAPKVLAIKCEVVRFSGNGDHVRPLKAGLHEAFFTEGIWMSEGSRD